MTTPSPDFSILGDIHAPGIYFGLSEEKYHADKSLSNSGIKDLVLGPLDYWSKSRLNPDYEDEETASMLMGNAYHKMFLEGREEFEATYAVKPDPADYPGALIKGDDMRAWLKAKELKVGGSIKELCDLIRETDKKVPLWPEIMAEFETTKKTVLPSDVYKNIVRAGLVLNRLPSVQNAFKDGYPEVSIFWRDKKTGVPMKCRIDYLKTNRTIDLKGFSNKTKTDIEEAVAKAVCNERYHVQAVVYSDGVEQAKAMLKKLGKKAVKLGTVPDEWLDAFRDSPAHPWFFVFVQFGKTPNIIGREFLHRESYAAAGGSPITDEWQEGDFLYRWKVEEFSQFVKTFGAEPWIVDRPAKPFATTDFPPWMFPMRRAA